MPSFTQPTGGTPQSFLDAASLCTYDATVNALRDASGLLRYPLFTATAGAVNVAEWGLGELGSVPAAQLEARAFAVLTQGLLQADGSIKFNGWSYRVRYARHSDGTGWAEAVQV